MDTNMNDNSAEGSTFGTYPTTTKVNGVQSQFTPNVDAIPSADAEFGGYQIKTNEIDHHPSGGDILKATSDTPVSGGMNSASSTDENNTYSITNVDVLQASSATENEGAQFGEYRTTTKVNGVQSIYTPNIDAKILDEDENTTLPVGGQTTTNTTTTTTTTNFNLEGFDFGSANAALQSDTGVTLGNVQNMTTANNLGFENFGSSVDVMQSASNTGAAQNTQLYGDFDFDSYLKNVPNDVAKNTNTSPNNDKAPTENVNLAGIMANIPGQDMKQNLKTTSTTTTTQVTKTTSTVGGPSNLQNYDATSTSSPVLDSFPGMISDEQLAPKSDTNALLKEFRDTLRRQQQAGISPMDITTTEQTIQTNDYPVSSPPIDTTQFFTQTQTQTTQTTQMPSPIADTGLTLTNMNQTNTNFINIEEFLKSSAPTAPANLPELQVTKSPLETQTYTQTSPVKYDNFQFETTYKNMPTTVTNTYTTQNLGSAVEFGDYKTTTKIEGVKSQFMPDIDANPTFTTQTTYTTMPPTVTNTYTTPNLGASAEFGEYRTTTKIAGIQSQFMPDVDAVPTPTYTQNNIIIPTQTSIVTPPILPPPVQRSIVKVPTVQRVVVPKVQQVYAPSSKKILVKRPPVTSSVTLPITSSYTQSTFVPSPAPITTAIPIPGTIVTPNIPVTNSLVAVKPPVVPVPPNNGVLIANAPGLGITPYSQASIPAVQPRVANGPYSQASIPVVTSRFGNVPYSQASIPVVPPVANAVVTPAVAGAVVPKVANAVVTPAVANAVVPKVGNAVVTPAVASAVVPHVAGAVVPPVAGAVVPHVAGAVVPPVAGAVVPKVGNTVVTPALHSNVLPPVANAVVRPAVAGAVVPKVGNAVVTPAVANAVVPHVAGAVVPKVANAVVTPAVAGAVVPKVANAVVTPAVANAVVPHVAGAVVPTVAGAVVPPVAGAVVPPVAGAVVPPVAGAVVPPVAGAVVPPVATVPYSQTSIPVVQQRVGTVPYSQASIPVQSAVPTTLPVQQTPLPAAYSGVGMNRPNIYNASTYRNNLGRNNLRNVNRNNVVGNMGAPSHYSTRTYNARRL